MNLPTLVGCLVGWLVLGGGLVGWLVLANLLVGWSWFVGWLVGVGWSRSFFVESGSGWLVRSILGGLATSALGKVSGQEPVGSRSRAGREPVESRSGELLSWQEPLGRASCARLKVINSLLLFIRSFHSDTPMGQRPDQFQTDTLFRWCPDKCVHHLAWPRLPILRRRLPEVLGLNV